MQGFAPFLMEIHWPGSGWQVSGIYPVQHGKLSVLLDQQQEKYASRHRYWIEETDCRDSKEADWKGRDSRLPEPDSKKPYAQMMLTFAGEKGANSAFSTEFGQSKRQLKERIDYMLDGKTKKQGSLSIAVVCGLLLTMGLMVSCGSGPQEEAGTEAEDAGQGETEDINGQNGEPGGPSREEPPEAEAESNGAQKIPYDPNNEYNEMIRC